MRERTRPDGTPYTRWVAQVSIGPRERRRVVRRVCRTREEAEAALRELPAKALVRRQRGFAVPEVVTRFYSHVSKDPHPKGCWEWIAYRYPTGYGHFTREGKSGYSHRVALEMTLGRPLDPGEWALHKCDNTACVRVDPEHVYLGSAADNARDRRKVETSRHRPVGSRTTEVPAAF